MEQTAQSARADGFGEKQTRLTKGGSISTASDCLDAARPLPVWKRALDLVLLTLSAPLWLPVAGLLAAWIRIVSPGPIFFRQVRIGSRGRPFTLWKFRTMHADADEGHHTRHVTRLIAAGAPMEKLDACDPRLIPGARLVRSLGIDELAQLANVLRGDMSLVGPRPCTVAEYACSQAVSKARDAVLPGITGLWQVSGKNRTTFRRMLALDRAYRVRQSVWFDLVILLRTAPAVLAHVLEIRRATLAEAAAANPLTAR